MGKSYRTTFPLTESPISESGVWTHLATANATVNTAGGIAFGTQTGTGAVNDSYAHLSGFAPDQAASATVHLGSISGGFHEVEILLHFSDSANSATGYECNLAFDGSYTQIVRWDSPAFSGGSFTFLSPPNGNPTGNPGSVHDGDIFSAQIIGSTIRVYLNGKLINSFTGDTTYKTGNPAMGMFRSAASSQQNDYGFTTFEAHDVDTPVIVSAVWV